MECKVAECDGVVILQDEIFFDGHWDRIRPRWICSKCGTYNEDTMACGGVAQINGRGIRLKT